MTNLGPNSGRWLGAIVAAVALVAGVTGVLLGALLIPRTEIVEKPVEVQVEKRVEVPVERQVIVERKVETPSAPFKYLASDGGLRTPTEEELKVALLMRDDIRKADAAERMDYEASAIFNPGQCVKLFVSLNEAANARLSASQIRAVAAGVLKEKGLEVLGDDVRDRDWNTLVHVEIELTDSKTSGRVAVVVRQGMLGFSNRAWRKVNVGVAHYGAVEDFGREPDRPIDQAVTRWMAAAAADLVKAK